jgi:RNA polymerase sigma factor (sigma-70 family)
MISLKIRNKNFEIPKNSKQNDSLTKVDWLAKKFYETEDEKYADALICVITPYIRKVADSFCANKEDAEELEQELKIELWKLLCKWFPKRQMKFNYLMRKLLYNLSCNFANRLKKQPEMQDLSGVESLLDRYNFVEDFENRELIQKLSKMVDAKTDKIFEIVLKGINKSNRKYVCKHSPNYDQIGKELGISKITVKRKLLKCRPLVLKLMEERIF